MGNTNVIVKRMNGDRVKIAALFALFLCALPGVALAKPFPAGRCTTLDDSTVTPKPPVVGPRPAIIVLPDVDPPKMGAPGNSFIADLVLALRPDGTIASVRALCTNVPDRRYTNALVRVANDWHFGAQKPKTRYAYRVVISARGDTVTAVPLR